MHLLRIPILYHVNVTHHSQIMSDEQPKGTTALGRQVRGDQVPGRLLDVIDFVTWCIARSTDSVASSEGS